MKFPCLFIFVPLYFSNDDHIAWKYQANALEKTYYDRKIASASSFIKYHFNGKANFRAKFEFNFLVEHRVAALQGSFAEEYL